MTELIITIDGLSTILPGIGTFSADVGIVGIATVVGTATVVERGASGRTSRHKL